MEGEGSMRAAILTAFAVSAVMAAFAAPGAAQQQPLTFKDGTVNIDREKYKRELEQLERGASRFGQARAFRRNDFCIVCDDGTRINCRVPVGGEPGRLLCGFKGVLLCSNNTGRVDFGRC
jgi:hypothetical protein